MKTTRTERTKAADRKQAGKGKATKKAGRKKSRAEQRADAFNEAFQQIAAAWRKSK